MPNPDRLTGLDASFLAIEKGGAHMHVGSVLVLDGPAPDYEDFVAAIEQRLHLVPRYRQKLAFPPFGQGRPVWVDDPHFNARYHIRHTALPEPAGEEELRKLAGRLFSQALDRTKPLWEIALVERVGRDEFALICKTHHALVDGVSGVDIMAVLFDLEADPPEREPAPAWFPRPEPSGASLLADTLSERAEIPLSAAKALGGVLEDPRATVRAASAVAGLGLASLRSAPPSPLNVRVGPHRRFAWATGDLDRFKAIKGALGGTVNDVVLTVVAGALRSLLRRRGREPQEGLLAMVPVSVRTDEQRGALGNRVSAMYAPLPVQLDDPGARFAAVHAAMGDLKASGQAVGAEVLTSLAGFAAPTILDQAARLAGSQRLYNLTVTNVPGPQLPLYMLGRKLRAFYPEVPLTPNTALGIAIMSYDGSLYFGLLGDYDAMEDLDEFAGDVERAIAELAAAAGVTPSSERGGRARSATRRSTRAKRSTASGGRAG
ncbi:MAG TPA: wax ester/triacylglycerol synthase family O-acyltransferase [Solirubrobacteraceae bacterium]|nr:wax ester/triacylglycerol synthase family O-acyltransferase [Solirubrobacteraceae bacterium]